MSPFATTASRAAPLFSTFDRSGVWLAYPANWVLEEGDDPEARLCLTISSPNTAFWSLFVYAETLDLGHAVAQAIHALRAEYPELEANEGTDEIAGATLHGQDARFFCFDLTSTARVRGCHRDGATYLILCQAEDRELATVDAVFDAITHSLLVGRRSAGAEGTPR